MHKRLGKLWDYQNHKGRTVLMAAAKAGHAEAVGYMLANHVRLKLCIVFLLRISSTACWFCYKQRTT